MYHYIKNKSFCPNKKVYHITKHRNISIGKEVTYFCNPCGYTHRKVVQPDIFAESGNPTHNNARAEICRCGKGDVWLLLRSIVDCAEIYYCPHCGGKLSPVA